MIKYTPIIPKKGNIIEPLFNNGNVFISNNILANTDNITTNSFIS